RALPERRSPLASLVATVRMLDLDDVGAERGEDLRTVGPGQRARHIDDPHPVQRQECFVHTRSTIVMLAFLNGLIDALTGSMWTYPLLFGICAGDAVFPALPSETAMIVCGIQAARGQLSLPVVLVVGSSRTIRCTRCSSRSASPHRWRPRSKALVGCAKGGSRPPTTRLR